MSHTWDGQVSTSFAASGAHSVSSPASLLLGVAVWVVVGKSTELAGASAYLTQLRWEWIALAAVAELACYASLATVERVLLRAGQVPARLGRLTAITFAASAIQSALPVGAAFAGVYNFRQYQLAGSRRSAFRLGRRSLRARCPLPPWQRSQASACRWLPRWVPRSTWSEP